MTYLPKPSLTWLLVVTVAGWAIYAMDAPFDDAFAADAVRGSIPVPLVTQPQNRAIVDGRHIQPRNDDLTRPDQTDIGSSDARILEELYRKQMRETGLTPGR